MLTSYNFNDLLFSSLFALSANLFLLNGFRSGLIISPFLFAAGFLISGLSGFSRLESIISLVSMGFILFRITLENKQFGFLLTLFTRESLTQFVLLLEMSSMFSSFIFTGLMSTRLKVLTGLSCINLTGLLAGLKLLLGLLLVSLSQLRRMVLRMASLNSS